MYITRWFLNFRSVRYNKWMESFIHPIRGILVNTVVCIVFNDDRLHSTFRTWNVHIRNDFLQPLIPPFNTQPLDFPIPWIQCFLCSVIDVYDWNWAASPSSCDELYCKHLFSCSIDQWKLLCGEIIVHEYFVSNSFNFLNHSMWECNIRASHVSFCFATYTVTCVTRPGPKFKYFYARSFFFAKRWYSFQTL